VSFPPRRFSVPTLNSIPAGRLGRGVAHPGLMWPRVAQGSLVLRVRFVGGKPANHARVIEWANAWGVCASIELRESADFDAEIRVGFDPSLGDWSYLGTDSASNQLGYSNVSMNLATVEAPTVLHEFGHALGLNHEHQHPCAAIELIEHQVIKDLAGPPYFWTESEIRRNVLQRLATPDVMTTPFDPESIMIYALPGRWLRNGKSVAMNTRLSAGDIATVQQMYGARS